MKKNKYHICLPVSNYVRAGLIPIAIGMLIPGLLQAQTMTRFQMNGNITSNIYENSTRAITGQNLQNVLLNGNNSYVNLKTDTGFVAMFNSAFTNYQGMAVIHGSDSIYQCKVSSCTGAWNLANFRFLQTIGGAGGASASGNPNYEAVFTGTNTLGSGHIYDMDTTVQAYDVTDSLSADFNRRQLIYIYNCSGTNEPLVSIDWGLHYLYDNGPDVCTPVISEDYCNRYLFGSDGVDKLTWANATSPSNPSDIVCVSYLQDYYTPFCSSSGLQWHIPVFNSSCFFNGDIVDDTVDNLYQLNSNCTNPGGGGYQTSLDWGLHYLFVNNQNISEDWCQRILVGADGNPSNGLTWSNGYQPSAGEITSSDIVSYYVANEAFQGQSTQSQHIAVSGSGNTYTSDNAPQIFITGSATSITIVFPDMTNNVYNRDGFNITIVWETSVASVTLQEPNGYTINAPVTSGTADTSDAWTFDVTNNTWARKY